MTRKTERRLTIAAICVALLVGIPASVALVWYALWAAFIQLVLGGAP